MRSEPDTERTPARRRHRPSRLLLLFLFLILAAVGYVIYRLNQPTPTHPIVTITRIEPEAGAVANQPITVFADAIDPDGIAQAELWVNGQSIATQLNPQPTSDLAFSISQTWMPTGTGTYSLFVRAQDPRGYLGQSEILPIQVLDKSVQPDPNANTQVIVEPGDTIASLAEQFGTTPQVIQQRNPDLQGEPTPGSSVLVPSAVDNNQPNQSTNGDSAVGTSTGGGSTPTGGAPTSGGSTSTGGGAIPHVDPPPPPAPPTGGGTEAAPLPPPWWSELPLGDLIHWGELVCVLNPDVCLRSSRDEAPPAPPTDVNAVLVRTTSMRNFHRVAGLADMGGLKSDQAQSADSPPPPGTPTVTLRTCRVRVTWTDRSNDEVGFKIYRYQVAFFIPAPELVAIVSPIAGMGSTGSYMDAAPRPGAQYWYQVRSFDATMGDGISGFSDPITIPDDCPAPAARSISNAVVVEALDLTTTEAYDKLYCYVSLAAVPYERVPERETAFITALGARDWNIAAEFSGRNRRAVVVPEGQPLVIDAECLGWQGSSLTSLGRIDTSDGPPRWDGRTLTATSGSGKFTVTYRITRLTVDTAGGLTRLTDPGIPAPFNLRAEANWRSCGSPTDYLSCSFSHGPGLWWDYPSSTSPPVRYFKVYQYLPDDPTRASAPTLYNPYDYDPISKSVALPTCFQNAIYRVSAVVGSELVTGGTIESPLSESLYVPGSCTATLAVTLEDLNTGGNLCDAIICSLDRTLEAYGWFTIGPVTSPGHFVTDETTGLRWNSHCEYHTFLHVFHSVPQCGSFPGRAPDITSVGPNRTYHWDSMYLLQCTLGGVCPESFGTGHNVVEIPAPASADQSVEIDFLLMDADNVSPDDRWCQPVRGNFLAPRAVTEWGRLDTRLGIVGLADDGSCSVTVHVQGR
jgi:Bacterial Ig domain/LysM domain